MTFVGMYADTSFACVSMIGSAVSDPPPFSLEKEVVIIFAATNGYVDDIPALKVKDFERDLLRFLETQYTQLAEAIGSSKKFDAELEKQTRAMLDEFKKTNTYADKAPEKAAPKAASDKPAAPAATGTSKKQEAHA